MFDHLIHIHQQFKQRLIGIELQQFKTVVTKPGTLRYEIEAYNECLLLTNSLVLRETCQLTLLLAYCAAALCVTRKTWLRDLVNCLHN